MSALSLKAVRQTVRTLPPYWPLFAVWLLTMIALPILRWTNGDATLPITLTIATIGQVVCVLGITVTRWGWWRVVLTAGAVSVLAWVVEYVGSHTGFPFGVYTYTARLQPQLGAVPLLIPLAWLMMLPPAWAVAELIQRRFQPHRLGWSRRLSFVVLSALAFTAWDLYLDPQKVAWGFWYWADPHGYFGIPWVNFAGWILASAAITFIVNPRALPYRPLILIYAIVWLFQFGGLAFFWGLPGPALGGFMAMGTMLGLAWFGWRKDDHAANHAAKQSTNHADP